LIGHIQKIVSGKYRRKFFCQSFGIIDADAERNFGTDVAENRVFEFRIIVLDDLADELVAECQT
jgi:hypothetical protein